MSLLPFYPHHTNAVRGMETFDPVGDRSFDPHQPVFDQVCEEVRSFDRPPRTAWPPVPENRLLTHTIPEMSFTNLFSSLSART